VSGGLALVTGAARGGPGSTGLPDAGSDDQDGAEDVGRVVGVVWELGHPGQADRGEDPAGEHQGAGAEAG